MTFYKVGKVELVKIVVAKMEMLISRMGLFKDPIAVPGSCEELEQQSDLG